MTFALKRLFLKDEENHLDEELMAMVKSIISKYK